MAKYRDGDFYINNANQDFYLRENGVWVRKGNIRDEGSTGLVGVAPIIGLGFNMQSSVQRIRYLSPDALTFGFDQAQTVERIRYLFAPMGLGVSQIAEIDRTRYLLVEMGLGTDQAAALASYLFLSAEMNLGFVTDATVSAAQGVVQIMADLGLGFDTSASIIPLIRLIEAEMALGLSLSASVEKLKSLVAAMDLGLSESAEVMTGPAPDTPATFEIVGAPVINATLTVVVLTDDPNGGVAAITGYSWKNGSGTVLGTASSYTPVPDDIGEAVTCDVTYTDGAGNVATVTTASVTIADGVFAIGSSNTTITSDCLLFYSGVGGTLLADPADKPIGAIQDIKISPDLAYLAVLAANSSSSAVFVYDVRTGAPALIPAGATIVSGNPRSMCWSPDGAYMCVTTTAATYILETATWTTTQTLPSSSVSDWSPDGTRLALNNPTTVQNLVEYDTSTWTAATAPGTQPAQRIDAIKYSPNGDYLALFSGSSQTLAKAMVYKRPAMTLCTVTVMPSTAWGIAGSFHDALVWKPDSSLFVVSNSLTTPNKFNIVTRSGDIFAGAAPTDDTSGTSTTCLSFSNDGTLMRVMSGTSINLYATTVSGFARMSDDDVQQPNLPRSMGGNW